MPARHPDHGAPDRRTDDGMTERMRLRAEDIEDLAVIAALLQDARLSLAEMVFDPKENRFAAAFTRYRRELGHDPATCAGLTEISTALVFDCIDEVKHRGLDPDSPTQEFALLTIATEPGETWLFHINLIFEGDRAIQLRSYCIDCRLDDFGEARRSVSTPCDHFAALLGAGASARPEQRGEGGDGETRGHGPAERS